MNRIIRMAILTTLAVAASSANADTAAEVQVSDAYVRAVPPGQPNSAAFMTLANTGSSDRQLVAARGDVARSVELHTHTMHEGMMQMRQVERIELPANSEVTLQPGGLHVMLIGLKQELEPGQEIAFELLFRDGSSLAVTVPVKKMQMKMMKPGMKH